MNDDIILTDSYDFDDRIENGLVLVFYFDHYDPTSRAVEEIIDELSQEYSESIITLAVDVEQSPDLAYRMKVETVPTTAVYSKGREAVRAEGANMSSVYREMLDDVIMNYGNK